MKKNKKYRMLSWTIALAQFIAQNVAAKEISYSGTTQISSDSFYLDINSFAAKLVVEELYASAGERVSEGDKLLKFTDESYQDAVSYYQAALMKAVNALTDAQREYDNGILEAQKTYDIAMADAENAEFIRDYQSKEVENAIRDHEEILEKIQERIDEIYAGISDGSYTSSSSGNNGGGNVSGGNGNSNTKDGKETETEKESESESEKETETETDTSSEQQTERKDYDQPEKPNEDQPNEEQQREELPNEEKTNEEQSTDVKPNEEQPGEEQLTEGKPDNGQPGEEQSSEGKPDNGQSGEEQPTEGKPNEEKTTESRPNDDTTGETQETAPTVDRTEIDYLQSQILELESALETKRAYLKEKLEEVMQETVSEEGDLSSDFSTYREQLTNIIAQLETDISAQKAVNDSFTDEDGEKRAALAGSISGDENILGSLNEIREKIDKYSYLLAVVTKVFPGNNQSVMLEQDTLLAITEYLDQTIEITELYTQLIALYESENASLLDQLAEEKKKIEDLTKKLSETETKPNTEKPTQETKPETEKSSEETKPETEKSSEVTRPETEKTSEETRPETEKLSEETRPDIEKPSQENQAETERLSEETKPEEDTPTEETKPDKEHPFDGTNPDGDQPTEETKKEGENPFNGTKPNGDQTPEETNDSDNRNSNNKSGSGMNISSMSGMGSVSGGSGSASAEGGAMGQGMTNGVSSLDGSDLSILGKSFDLSAAESLLEREPSDNDAAYDLIEELEESKETVQIQYEELLRNEKIYDLQIHYTYDTAILSGKLAVLTWQQEKESLENTLQSFRDTITSLENEQEILTTCAEGILTADRNGTLCEVNYEEEDTINPMTAIASYYKTDVVTIDLQVPQEEIVSLQVGDYVDVKLGNRSGYEGVVSEKAVEPDSDTSRSDVRYTVTVSVDNADGRISAGTAATVTLKDQTGEENDEE